MGYTEQSLVAGETIVHRTGLRRIVLPGAQRTFLAQRIAEGQPALSDLQKKLLSFGGEMLVALPGGDPAITVVLKFGIIMQGPVTFKKMSNKRGHQNVEKLWVKCKHGIIATARGYALSPDGLWRCHAWGILEDGLLETTTPRTMYFGIPFHLPEDTIAIEKVMARHFPRSY